MGNGYAEGGELFSKKKMGLNGKEQGEITKKKSSPSFIIP
jgi:hypothetical protein